MQSSLSWFLSVCALGLLTCGCASRHAKETDVAGLPGTHCAGAVESPLWSIVDYDAFSHEIQHDGVGGSGCHIFNCQLSAHSSVKPSHVSCLLTSRRPRR